MRTYWFRSCAFLTLFLLPAIAVAQRPLAGQPGANALGVDGSGRSIKLEDFRGSVAIVNFWATWCAPCLEELPILVEIQRQAGSRLRIVAVNIDDDTRQAERVRRLLGDSDMIHTVDKSKIVRRAYDAKMLPHSVLVDRQGTVYRVYVGITEATVPDLVRDVNFLLEAR